jgi:L-asparaginase
VSNKVLILHTGGTLGMRPKQPDRTLAPDEFGSTVLEHVPELSAVAEVETRVLFNLDSTDMTPANWLTLGREIASEIDSFGGIVITHGTDTMAYTASALSYLLRNLPRPVILTGSQRPLADARTDGRANLAGAVDLALRDIPEVAIYFDGKLLRGNRATKTSTFAFGAFESPHFLPLAEVGTTVRLLSPVLRPAGPFRAEGSFDRRIAVVRLAPGCTALALRALLDTEVAAVLLVALGPGNIPVDDDSVARSIAELTEAGKVVAIGSPSLDGRVDLATYAGGRLARESGAVGIGDMTIEAAAVKLMYLLGSGQGPDQVRSGLRVSLAGEIGDAKPSPVTP